MSNAAPPHANGQLDNLGFVELKWAMGTGLVVQNNAPLTSSSELIAYRFF